MVSGLPGIWLALIFTWNVNAQTTAPAPAPDAAREAFRKGIEAYQKKDLENAAQLLIQVPELGGYLSLYKHWYLGLAYLEMNKFKEAEPEFLKVVNLKASTELTYQAQFYLGEVALRQGKHMEAVQRLAPLESKWRRSYRYPEVLYRLMVADQNLGRTSSLCTRARKLYAKHPAHPLVIGWGSDLDAVELQGKKLPCQASKGDFTDRVRSLQWSGESEKAHKEIVARMSRAPESDRYDLDMTLASFFIADGSVDDALNLLIRYYPQQKSNTKYLTLLGRAAARSGEYQTAVGAYERAHTLNPQGKAGREALYQAAFLSYQFQDYDGAVRKFNQFIKANPTSGLARDAQWHLAWLQYLRNDFKGALAKFDEVFKKAERARGRARLSESLRERLVYWMAMSHIRLKEFNEAKDDLESIIARNPYSYYGLAAQARLESIRAKVEELAAARKPTAKTKNAPVRMIASVSSPAEVVAPATEDESEEDLAEKTEVSPEEVALEGGDDGPIQASDFKDPALRARIDVAQQLIQMGLHELARWELWEVERHTRNPQYLRMLINAYEGIASYHRSATIAELSFGREREQQGLEVGRALWASMFPQAYKNFVSASSSQFGVPPEWIWAIMRAESMYKPDVMSPVGAKGLMQLMTYTARNLSRLASVDEDPELLNPQVNIRYGSQYLARLQQKFKGQLPLVAAAYNAGPHRVEGWLVNFGHLETDEFVEHIPFVETRNYVKKVVRNHTFYRRLYAKDQKPVDYLAKTLGVPIPSRAATRESWDSL